MQKRKDALEIGEYYHIYSRSIAGYEVFNDTYDYGRIIKLLELYRYSNFEYKYSKFITLEVSTQISIIEDMTAENDLLVNIVAYCIMPTHIHLLLKQLKKNGISKFMSRILNGYSKYFNSRHKRQGPLWTGRFKNVLVDKDEQLLHLTRYIHLNPTSAGLIKKPEDWKYSSYHEYLNQDVTISLCNKDNLFDLNEKSYRKFVSDRKTYQRELSIIKKQLIDGYTG